MFYPVDMKWKLITPPKGFKCKLTVEDIYLSLRKTSVSDAVMIQHDAGLEISNWNYPFGRTDIHARHISSNSYYIRKRYPLD